MSVAVKSWKVKLELPYLNAKLVNSGPVRQGISNIVHWAIEKNVEKLENHQNYITSCLCFDEDLVTDCSKLHEL